MAKFNASAAQSGESNDNFDLGIGEKYAPTIMFMKGDPSVGKAIAKATKMKLQDVEDISYHGGFFITDDDVPRDEDGQPIDLTTYGWEIDSFESKSTFVKDDTGEMVGKEVQGYSRKELRFALCNLRLGFRASKGDDLIGTFPSYNEAEKHGRVTGVLNILAVIEGMEELGKFILSFSGHAQMAMLGNSKKYAGKSVFDGFKKILDAAYDVKPGDYKARAFWMAARASIDDNCVPQFVTAGSGASSSQIVIPQYCGPTSNIDLDDVFVGVDLKKQFDEISADAQEWAEEWKTPQIREKTEDKPKADDENPFDANDDELAGMM